MQVQTDLDDSVHRTIFEKTDRVLGTGDDGTPGGGSNPQNNILPMVGELAQVLEAPEVVGALTSILGDGYVMLPHRHCHTNMPVAPLPDGRRGITMVPHRDGQAGCHKPRHRVPRWAIVFYYPQECPDRQGPTALIPGSHLRPRLTTELNLEMPLAVDRGADGEYRLPANYLQRRMTSLACGLGAVSIMHFDLGHSVLTNIAENMRYGHKFVFMRTEEPARPSWATGIPTGSRGRPRSEPAATKLPGLTSGTGWRAPATCFGWRRAKPRPRNRGPLRRCSACSGPPAKPIACRPPLRWD